VLGALENLSESYPAVADSIPAARSAVAEFAAHAGLSEDKLQSVTLASSEALTNAVLHAYRGEPGLIHVDAAVVSGELWVLVSDEGHGLRPADRPGLGLGLGLISQVSDDFSLMSRAGGGVELRMCFHRRGGGRAGAHGRDHARGSRSSASRPASSRFSTTK